MILLGDGLAWFADGDEDVFDGVFTNGANVAGEAFSSVFFEGIISGSWSES